MNALSEDDIAAIFLEDDPPPDAVLAPIHPTEFDLFLRYLSDDPQNHDLLLIMADWLEERGDPRADSFRLQHAVDCMDADDPERLCLQLKANALQVSQLPFWIPDLDLRGVSAIFEWGLPVEFTVPTHFLYYHGEDALPSCVRRLRIYGRDAMHIDTLLGELDFWRYQLVDMSACVPWDPQAHASRIEELVMHRRLFVPSVISFSLIRRLCMQQLLADGIITDADVPDTILSVIDEEEEFD